MGKFISKEEFETVRKELKKADKKIILCHGVFDLVHPGHIIHFEEAKKLGDILVVSITAAQFVRKGPGRPYFNDEMRVKVLASMEQVDYVLISEGYTVDDIIKVVQPDLYVKGQEYAKSELDITGKISEETDLVRKFGGDVYFTDGAVFSATNLINNCLPSLTNDVKEFVLHMKEQYSFHDVKAYVENLKKLRVLVVGDVIIDNYTFCDMQGIMSKDRGYSVRHREEKEYMGGALAIARHIAQFTDEVTVASIIGNESEIHSKILNDLGKNMRLDLEYSEECNTIVKRRFVAVNEKREEFDKLFSVNNLPKGQIIAGAAKERFKERLREIIKDYDIVVAADFGHGLLDSETMDIVQDGSRFLALNCQTNSSNYGMNLIIKYHHADAFVLDQKEIKLAFHDNRTEESELLKVLLKQLGGKTGWLTQASSGASGIEGEQCISCPALTLSVKDTIGAGDAFFSVASLCAATEVPLEVATFLGNIAGALAANIVGNEKPVNKVDLLKYANTLMNL